MEEKKEERKEEKMEEQKQEILKIKNKFLIFLNYLSPSEVDIESRIEKSIRKFTKNILFSILLYGCLNEKGFFSFFWYEFFNLLQHSLYFLIFLLFLEPFWLFFLYNRINTLQNIKNATYIIMSTVLTCAKGILDILNNFIKELLDN